MTLARVDPSRRRWPDAGRLARALRSAAPALLFGLRLWASVCLALYVAFWLELDNPFWAGTRRRSSASRSLGASLRKGWFRMIGTVDRRRGDRGADRLLSARPRRLSRRPGAVGRRLRASSPRCCATSRPTRRRWPAIRRRSSPATSSARSAARTARPSCSRSPAPARSASASSAPASFSPGPISAARGAGWPRMFAAISAEIAGRFHRHVGAGRAGASGHAAGPARIRPPRHRARPGHRRGARRSPPICAIIRRSCRRRWTACSPPWPAGGRWRLTSSCCRRTRHGARRTPSCECSRRSCDGAGGGRAGTLDRRSDRPAPDLRRGGRRLIALPARHAVAAAARRPGGRGAGWHRARARRAGLARRRSRAARSCAAGSCPAARARLAARSRQCRARLRHDRRRRAVLDRHRLAERRLRHHLRRDRRHPVRAARRSGLRHRGELHARHGP